MKKLLTVSLLLFPLTQSFGQVEEADSIEIYLIDSYVSPTTPYTFKLYFFTSEPCFSEVIFLTEQNKDYQITTRDQSDEHKINIPLSEINADSQIVPFRIEVTNSKGETFSSELYEFELPYEMKVETGSNYLVTCLFGGLIYMLPSPTVVLTNNNVYFAITKELPLISIYSGGYNYPQGYFALEYSHTFGPVKNRGTKNILRIGYKHIFEVPVIKYISPGINGFTNFNGFNGISPEVSVGFITVLNSFTLYGRYRFNFKPGEIKSEFSEFSIGLFSNFLSFQL